MEKSLKEHLENVIVEYSTGKDINTLIEAKEEYFKITGKVNEDDEDYELRMNSFNEWFIYQYQSPNLMERYIEEKGLPDPLKNSLLSLNYSFFEFLGDSFRKKLVFKDYLNDKKIYLDKNNYIPNVLKDDIFIGRFLGPDEDAILLEGLCFIPKSVKSVIKKQIKKLKKAKKGTINIEEKNAFLLHLESLKNRWARYGHIDPSKIFYFND